MSSVYLRALSINDLEFTYKWHSDRDLYTTLAGPFRHVSIDAEREWLKSKSDYSNKELNLMICLEDHNQPIGMVSIREIDWICRKGYFTGLLIGEKEHRGKGFGTEALQMLLKHCFEDLGLNRIWGELLDSNKPSLKMLQNCGFEIEGCLHQHAFKVGNYLDVVIVGLCAEKYFLTK